MALKSLSFILFFVFSSFSAEISICNFQHALDNDSIRIYSSGQRPDLLSGGFIFFLCEVEK
jgi:hypothetical protein